MENQNTSVSLKARITELEGMIKALIGRGKHSAVEVEEHITEFISRTVKAIRTKGRMFRVLDYNTVFEGIKEVEEDVYNLSKALIANAKVMEEVAAQHFRGSMTGEHKEERSLSTKSEADEGELPRNASSHVADSVASTSVTASSTVELQNQEDEDHHAQLAANIVAPLKELAEEASQDVPLVHELRQSIKMRSDKSSDFLLAKSVDFDECASPRAAVTPTRQQACQVFRFSPSGRPLEFEPLEPSLDQFSPMTPRSLAQRNALLSKQGAMFSEQSKEEEGHGGKFESVCESAVPPGLNPLAVTEPGMLGATGENTPAGHLSDDIMNENCMFVGDYSESPPRSMMQDLTSELQGRLNV